MKVLAKFACLWRGFVFSEVLGYLGFGDAN